MPRATLVEVEPGTTLEREDLCWRSVANGHTPEALSWRVEAADGRWSLVYTGDTGPDPRVVELARGAGVFLCECSFPEELAAANHLTPTTAGRFARAAGVRRLVLTHFYPALDPLDARSTAALVYDGPIELACDGLVIDLEEAPPRP